jgi:hypothetical protein
MHWAQAPKHHWWVVVSGHQGFLFLFGGGGGGELVGHGTGVQWAGGAMVLFVSGLGRLRGAGGLNVFELE